MERRLNIFWPLMLIASGAMWILIQIGRIPAANLWALAILWPVLLIAAGLGLILRPYWRYAGALMSALAIAGLFAAVVFAAQLGWNHLPDRLLDGSVFFAGPSPRGSGHVISETRNVGDFTAISIDYPAHVVIHQGAVEAFTIDAEDNVVAQVQTRVVDHVLMIDSPRGHAVIVPRTRTNITITVKDLSELDFDSAGDVTLQGLQADNFKAVLNGAGSMKFISLQVKSLDAVLSGVGSLAASGNADRLNVSVDGVGGFDGQQLKSQDANVSLNGLGNASVWADHSLTANVNGLGSVSYYGNAQVHKSVNGLGSVRYLGTK